MTDNSVAENAMNDPIVKVVNSSGVSNEKRADFERVAKFAGVASLQDVTPAKYSQVGEEVKQLEASAMPYREVDPGVRAFTEDAKDYFRKVARDEGYKEADDMLMVVNFIERDTFEKISPNRGGFSDPVNNGVYISYDISNPDRKYAVMASVFHELRHRVSRREFTVEIRETPEGEQNYNVKGKSLRCILGGMEDERSRGALMEEAFTVGWCHEHEKDVEVKEFQELRERRIENIRADGVQGEIDPLCMSANGYGAIFEIWKTLEGKVGDLLNVCIDVRSGKEPKYSLSKLIAEKFGKKGLAAVAYGGANPNLAALALKSYTSSEEGAEKIGDAALKEIVNKVDDSGKIASSLGLT